MKKYIVIGNPISHSLSPKLHNYWFKENNIKAIYEKYLLDEANIKSVIEQIKKKEIFGINVTVPFKKKIIPCLQKLTKEASISNSVNTIYLENDVIVGHNTDIAGFELAIRHSKFNTTDKKVLILGAGGVVSSLIIALKNLGVSQIIISNRTKEKALELKNNYKDLEIIEWGTTPDFDMAINATSLGLSNDDDEIKLDFKKIGSNKFFYDVIYNPSETNFLRKARENGNKTQNGKMMFIYQAHQAFTIWHKIMPEINEKTISLLNE
tara:strand:- start:155 stop:952 length:798 start_codon:yes stop_codon:yes gene_type:complete